MARPMTPAEKQRFRGYFPSLNVDQAVVTGETSTVYNCISWTVGVNDRWLWPGNSLVSFDTFYRGFGFVQAGDGPVAAWGYSSSAMTMAVSPDRATDRDGNRNVEATSASNMASMSWSAAATVA